MTTERERIARIIDPEAFSADPEIFATREWGSASRIHLAQAEMVLERRREAALAKESLNDQARVDEQTGSPAQTAPPTRVRLSRAKGWRMPSNTVKVDRSTRWGNPWRPGDPGAVRMACIRGGWAWTALPMALTLEGCLDRFRRWLAGEFTTASGAIRLNHRLYEAVICDVPPDLEPLRGKNLACWCAPGAPCHADVLLELANSPERDGDATLRRPLATEQAVRNRPTNPLPDAEKQGGCA